MAGLNMERPYTPAVAWNPFPLRRRREPVAQLPPPARSGYSLLEEVPIMAFVLDSRMLVRMANRMARDFFDISFDQVPDSFIILTREVRVEAAVRGGGDLHEEVRLVHHPSTVQVTVVPGLEAGEMVVFLNDLSELRRLQTVRQEFVANLSHELMTPITSLRLSAESLADELPEAAREKFANRAIKEADHLAAIVGNLRQLAEIEGGKPIVRMTRIQLQELVTEVAGRIHLDRELNCATEPGLVIHADREKLAQALANLLDNAAKFSPPSSPVEVLATRVGAEVVITVRDHGPGISPEHWDRVFERFYKVDPARSRETAGSGLGLAITKHLILLMGGRVWTEAADDGGQVFALGLPAEVITVP